jgi:WhiB family redox-sensing transcriptional regulator
VNTGASIPWSDVPQPGDWVERARCRGTDAPHFFPVSALESASEIARAICAGCPVRDDCAAYALDNPGLVGVWGGMDEHQRELARRRRRAAARRTPLGWVAAERSA